MKNVGGGILIGKATVAPPFIIISGASYSLPANASQEVKIRYRPTDKGKYTREIAFTGGGGASVTVKGSAFKLHGLKIKADDGELTGPFVAIGSGRIWQPVETREVADSGRSSYKFMAPASANYTVSALVNATGNGSNSFFVNIDAEPESPPHIWDVPLTSGYQARMASWRDDGKSNALLGAPKVFALTAGVHELIIRGREANVGLGEITIAAVSTATPTPPPVKPKGLVNVSSRTLVQSGDDVMIGGFIISGSTAKKVVVRGIGPSMAKAGVSGAMANPVLELHNSAGARIASSDNWTSRKAEVTPTGLAPTDTRESAIVASLNPGAYTAILRGASATAGVGLVELYDVDPTHSRIANISTRGKVMTGDNVMIGGFIIGGDQPSKVLIRAIGPSLTAHGVSGALQDPVLELHGSNGSLIFANNDWRTNQQAQIAATTIPPTNNKESAIIATLQPGNYTAVVRGAGHSSGVALVEVYSLD